jgi:hypothetical protein
MLLVTLGGCRVIHHDYRGDREISPGTQLSRNGKVVGKVEGSKKALFLLFGLIPLNSGSGPELAEDLAEASHGANFDGITRLRIDERENVVDVIVNSLVGILFSMMTVEVEGEVQQFVGARP